MVAYRCLIAGQLTPMAGTDATHIPLSFGIFTLSLCAVKLVAGGRSNGLREPHPIDDHNILGTRSMSAVPLLEIPVVA